MVLRTISLSHMQGPSALVPEMSLSERITKCLQYNYCTVGTHSMGQGDIAPGIVELVPVFPEVLNVAAPNEQVTSTREPAVGFPMGATTMGTKLCDPITCPKLKVNTEPAPDPTSTGMPKGSSLGASITSVLTGVSCPDAGPTNLEDGEPAQWGRACTKGFKIHLGVGEPPPKPPWKHPGMSLLGTNRRMEVDILLQWEALPSKEGAELTVNSRAAPPHSKTECTNTVGPMTRALSSSPMPLKLESHQDAEIQLRQSLSRPPLATGAGHQQSTEPGRGATPAGNPGLTQVTTPSPLAVQKPVPAAFSMAPPWPCWRNCRYLSRPRTRIPLWDRSPPSNWHRKWPLLLAIWRDWRQDPPCKDVSWEVKAWAGNANQEGRAAAALAGPVCLERMIDATMGAHSAIVGLVKQDRKAVSPPPGQARPASNSPETQSTLRLAQPPGKDCIQQQAGLMGANRTKASTSSQSAMPPLNQKIVAALVREWGQCPTELTAGCQPATCLDESTVPIQESVPLHTLGWNSMFPSLPAMLRREVTAVTVQEMPDLPDEPAERVTAVTMGKPTCRMRGVTTVTAWEPTCQMGRVTTVTAGQPANRCTFRKDQRPAAPEDETAVPPAGLPPEAVQQCNPPSDSQDKLSQDAYLEWWHQEGSPRPGMPAPDASALGTKTPAIILQLKETMTAAWGEEIKLDAPSDDPKPGSRESLTTSPSQDGDEGPGRLQARGGTRRHRALSPPAAVAVALSALRPTRAEPSLRTQANLSHREWMVTPSYPAGLATNHQPDHVQGDPEGGQITTVWPPPPAHVGGDPGSQVHPCQPAEETALAIAPPMENLISPEEEEAVPLPAPPANALKTPETDMEEPVSNNLPASHEVTHQMETTSPVEEPEEKRIRLRLVKAPSHAAPPPGATRVVLGPPIQLSSHSKGPETPANAVDPALPEKAWSILLVGLWSPAGPHSPRGGCSMLDGNQGIVAMLCTQLSYDGRIVEPPASRLDHGIDFTPQLPCKGGGKGITPHSPLS